MKCFSIFLLVVIIILTACGEIHIPPFRSEEIRTSTVIPVPSPTDTPLAPTLPAGPIVLFQSDRVIDLAVDPQAVYWLMRAGDNRSSDGVIMKLDRRDEKAQTLTDGLSQPNRLVSDIENLYWTETDPSDSQVTLMTAPKTGGTKYPLWEGPGYVASLALDEQFLYWSICTSKTSTLVKMPKRGGDIHPLVSGTGCPMSILLDGSRIYWVEQGLRALDLAGGEPSILFEDERLKSMVSLRDDRSYVKVQSILAIRSSVIYVGVYVDNYPGMISCTDQHTTIARLPVEGGEIQFLKKIPGSLRDAAFDGSSFYLVSNCSYEVLVLELQTGVESTLELGQQPVALALDGSDLYWADYEGVKVRSKSSYSNK